MMSIVLLGATLYGCHTFKDELTPDIYEEVPKQLDGTWKLKRVVRNGMDITELMDFSRFRLVLKSDSTYSIEHYLPFLVRKDGTWSIDDPTYPFFLTFREEGQTGTARTDITYPILDGKRHITLTISPGCSSNSYTYSFEKVND